MYLCSITRVNLLCFTLYLWYTSSFLIGFTLSVNASLNLDTGELDFFSSTLPFCYSSFTSLICLSSGLLTGDFNLIGEVVFDLNGMLIISGDSSLCSLPLEFIHKFPLYRILISVFLVGLARLKSTSWGVIFSIASFDTVLEVMDASSTDSVLYFLWLTIFWEWGLSADGSLTDFLNYFGKLVGVKWGDWLKSIWIVFCALFGNKSLNNLITHISKKALNLCGWVILPMSILSLKSNLLLVIGGFSSFIVAYQ